MDQWYGLTLENVNELERLAKKELEDVCWFCGICKLLGINIPNFSNLR